MKKNLRIDRVGLVLGITKHWLWNHRWNEIRVAYFFSQWSDFDGTLISNRKVSFQKSPSSSCRLISRKLRLFCILSDHLWKQFVINLKIDPFNFPSRLQAPQKLLFFWFSIFVVLSTLLQCFMKILFFGVLNHF